MDANAINYMVGEIWFFFFQAEDGIRDKLVTGVQTLCSSDLCTPPRNAMPGGGASKTFTPGCRRASPRASENASNASAGAATTPGRPTARSSKIAVSEPETLNQAVPESPSGEPGSP